jgi:uncharacterized membrane protein
MLIFAQAVDASSANPSELGRVWQLMGVFHPLIVHFPIALLLTAAFLELVSVWKKDHAGLRFAIVANLILGTIGAVVAAPLGWIDASYIHVEPDLRPVLAWHRWLGTSVAIGALITTIFWFGYARVGTRAHFWIYRAALWSLTLILSITGHLGGLLVYGLDYFSP